MQRFASLEAQSPNVHLSLGTGLTEPRYGDSGWQSALDLLHRQQGDASRTTLGSLFSDILRVPGVWWAFEDRVTGIITGGMV